VVGEPGEQLGHRAPGQLGLVRADRGQGGEGVPGLLDVVKADDGDVVRYPQAAAQHRVHGPDGQQVVVAEHRVRRRGLVQ
jgi:hypothetical protein